MTTDIRTGNHLPTWKFSHLKRWEISVTLQTTSPLHIGSGEQFETEVNDAKGGKIKVKANGFCKNKLQSDGALPIIPGSTLKGKLRNYLEKHYSDGLNGSNEHRELLEQVFGGKHIDEENQGNGGIAEFHDATLVKNCGSGSHYPYWDETRQTYIETSTAIDRHTKTALDRSLHYVECVSPGTQFKVTITGAMTDKQASMLLTALKTFEQEDSPIYFGADDSNGKGKMVLIGGITVKNLDTNSIIDWLKKSSETEPAYQSFKPLNSDKIRSLLNLMPELKPNQSPSVGFDIELKFDGPFIVNDPSQYNGNESKANHQPLIDHNGFPVLPSKSFRGAFRSQAERIIRNMGGECCDTKNPCKDTVKRCIACEIFGTTGWKTTLNISSFSYIGEKYPNITQEFVAIDRFHGGGKEGAKFNAQYVERPHFKGKISIAPRSQEIKSSYNNELSWQKGLLGLLFRDLQEGDIRFGFGANKGYGGIEETIISNLESISSEDIKAFRIKCSESAGNYPCDSINPKKNIDKSGLAEINPIKSRAPVFHNPYHFIPVKHPDTSSWLNKNELTNRSANSHAFYRQQTDGGEELHNGRIICKLTAETPFFVGANNAVNEGERAAILKEHYQLNGEIAIPATSLRGMVSALAEAASNSAMRVLDNGFLSYRKPMVPDQLLSAIGIVAKRGEDFHLIPLSMPTLKKSGNDYKYNKNQFNYKEMFPDGQAKLKVYLNNAYENPEMTDFLDRKRSWSIEKNEIYYLPLDRFKLKKGILKGDKRLLRTPGGNNKFAIGLQVQNGNGVPSDKSEADLTPGILRILGKEHRDEDMPKNKKHELFIPVAQGFVDDLEQYLKTSKAYPITSEAIETFEDLARQQTDSQQQDQIVHDEKRLPFNLKGTSREADHTLKIKHGDIVYFQPDEKGDKVIEIAFSSIWRDKVKGKVNDFYPEDILPFNKERETISPAELLFGFTELNDEKEIDTTQRKYTQAYAGKVRINPGLLHSFDGDAAQDNEVTLKALSSPKLPSPALYFKPKKEGQNNIAKSDLNCKSHQTQGRKMYLHAMRKEDDKSEVQSLTATGSIKAAGSNGEPWRSQDLTSERDNLKVRIKPVKKNTCFHFSIDFNNLTQWELGLLCYALQPDSAFRHKLGMGKPIGLGSVKIDIAALQTIDRKKRYNSDSLQTARYNESCWINQQLINEFTNELSDQYNQTVTDDPKLNPESLRTTFINTMEPDIYRAIELLGNPNNIKYPVHYPQLINLNIEEENFKWFMENDKKRLTSLESISCNTTKVPFLKR